ncbi:MAG TPA: transcription-repair coupling factor [bacterium]|nr:transcription-repair coupling factor [bacterium]
MTPLQRLEERIRSGDRRIVAGGLTGSSKAYVLSRLIAAGAGRCFVYLAPRARDAAKFQRDLEFFLKPFAQGEVFFFPPHDVLPFTHLSPHPQVACERLRTLQAFVRKAPPLFVATTVAAVLSPLPPKSVLEGALTLKAGTELDPKTRGLSGRDDFLRTLASWGYQNVPLVIDAGNIAVRGSLVDLYNPLEENPVRIEWLGDTVEALRAFDPKTQRSLGAVDAVTIIPVREVILDEKTTATFAEKARKHAEARDLSRSKWAEPLEKVREGIPYPGIETDLPLFYDRPTSFWDWLPEDAVLILDDAAAVSDAIDEHVEEVKTIVSGASGASKETLLAVEDVLATAAMRAALEGKRRLAMPSFDASGDAVVFETKPHTDLRHEIERSKKGVEPLAPLARHLQDWLLTDRVYLVSGSLPQAERLRDLLIHYLPHLPPVSKENFSEANVPEASAALLAGGLAGGFRLPSERVTFLTDEEIFGPKIRKPVREGRGGLDLSSFAELKNGDPVVHKEHGIGLYRGLIPMEVENVRNDFLIVEYQGGDKLYVPVYRMNLIQRYTGADGREPKLDKMGGASWAKIRGKSEKIIRELAGDLLNLYAARTAGHKPPFSPPNELFEAFEASFPYEETPDQDRAIAEVLGDMQKDKPMDRLVLGDVGYGKTEVALRAAFKAALDGRQVAFLVPTTLLAFQHYERFLQRFKDYPVNVDMISRFRSPAEQKATVKKIAEGKVDIVVGTHRLLQPDISFKNLGLLIMDEEHRFGVEQKEKIKRLKKNVDVLALSATPIPRTLYMSLVGIRPISVIETPPTDRLAIRTFVMPFEEEVVREAILREFKRGGQVFFVHNEVETIGRMKERLQTIVPEAKIGVGHGQMEDDDLEQVMIKFFHQEFNLLLCTTIIESGIDIPTANTILIHNADRFGLAQIYQLRGRVGRGGHRAYAYLLVEEGKRLTPEATQRLAVLQRFSDLGTGYKMASYDLEIRGAGNLLGTSQSGQMAAIGYELYTELLEKAIHELKGETALEEIDPELHFAVPAFISEDYIPDPPVRLEAYRRLSSLTDELEADIVREEMRDRFGELPPEAENLVELSTLKVHAKKLRLKQVRADAKHFVFAFDPSSPLNPDLLMERITRAPKRYRLTPDFRFIVTHGLEKPAEALAGAKKFLRELTLHLS